MKLVTKILLSFVLAIAVVGIALSALFASGARSIIYDQIQKKALVLVRTFESQIGSADGAEGPDGRNQAFAVALGSLSASFPDIVEINVYKIATAKVVASSQEASVGKDVDPEDIEAAQSDKTVVLFEREGGSTVIDVTSPMHRGRSINYVMGVKIDVGADLRQVDAAVLVALGAAFALLALVGVFALFLARGIVAPVKLAGASFRKIADGDAELSMRLDDRRSDELGRMAGDFNAFVDKLRGIVSSVKDSQERLASVASEFARGASDTNVSVSRIASSIEAARAKAETQAGAVMDSAGAIEEIAKNIEAMDGMIVDQAACVTQASASIEEMTASVVAVLNSMELMADKFTVVSASVGEGKSALEQAAGLVAGIAERSRSLQDANATIAEIASRTDLLAMNAAIEAAHAGNAGKGFSVVADEIRKLAESASGQSRAIKADIDRVLGSIDSVVASTGSLGKAFGKVESSIGDTNRLAVEVRSAMSEQGEGSKQLLGLVAKLNSLTSQVRDGSSEMAKGNETILNGTTRLRSAAEGMKSDMDDISLAAKELEDRARGTAESAAGAGRAVAAMEGAVGSFKL